MARKPYRPMFLEELVEKIETSTSQPDRRSIPKQWLPSWIRWPIRALMLPFLLLDQFAQKFARFFIRPPFKRKGKCKKCGKCCHYLLIPEPKGLLGRIQWLWLTQVSGFFLRDHPPVTDEEEPYLVMGCRYLKEDNSCAHHFLRPAICREWPHIERFERPQILPGCGYKIINKYQKRLKDEQQNHHNEEKPE